ncbi:hypothetical protein [Paenibacillus sp. GYB003]|uniref:hypothetical protein n=1 Tax=Paenibacillus sp. GYB003 TaxID=2994392 RepID=UPI002F96491F
MNSSGNVRSEEAKKIITYNNANGEVQIIVPKRESETYFTTETTVKLNPSEVRNLYFFLKTIVERGE